MLAVAVLATLSVISAAEINSGTYKGTYEGSSGSAGDIRLVLSKSTDGAWTGEASFWLGGQEVKCKVTSITVDGSKLVMVYSFDLQGNALESKIEGEFTGAKLTGKYRTRVPGDNTTVDEGTWTSTSGS